MFHNEIAACASGPVEGDCAVISGLPPQPGVFGEFDLALSPERLGCGEDR